MTDKPTLADEIVWTVTRAFDIARPGHSAGVNWLYEEASKQVQHILDRRAAPEAVGEPPLTNDELRLIGDVAGHLFDRCDANRGNSLFGLYRDEHDAVMRLRRRCDALEAALLRQLAAAKERDDE